LVYKFHTSTGVKQGALFETSIDAVLSDLSDKISKETSVTIAENTPNNDSRNKSTLAAEQEFNDELFSKAIISFESDWQSAVSFFETYVNLNPDSVEGRLYLTRLYLWQQRAGDADKVLSHIDLQLVKNTRQRAFVQFLSARIAHEQKQHQLAIDLFEHALQTLAQHSDWSLKADILLHQAMTFESNDKLTKAKQALQQSLDFYQRIESPIGINSIRLHLARVLFKLDEKDAAQQTFLLAQQAITTQNLDFLDSLLLEQKQILSF